jgi:hypothetical protein
VWVGVGALFSKPACVRVCMRVCVCVYVCVCVCVLLVLLSQLKRFSCVKNQR